ncbi:unnamed protein product [Cylicocyclus nassatus]|uniref:Uncharacterized protein n=1 Tax=Cylicocyclus nassatus TaxID=53992 RepID=A0AA36H6X6_CYLNA|nr:unnamed protein product [Cylicocyclus nassatus]
MQSTVKKALTGLIGIDIAVGIAFVLVVNLVGNGSDNKKDEKDVPAVFFAMHTDKDANVVRLVADENENEDECSLAKNVNVTKAAINEIKSQQFRFIFFTDKAIASKRMESSDALKELDEVENLTDLQTNFKQLPVLREFLNKSGDGDSLIYYIPCRFNNSAGGDDMEDFVKELNASGMKQSMLFVSAIEDGDTIKEWYKLDKGNVVGKGESVVERIKEFVAPKTTTTAKPSPTEASVTTLSTTEVSITEPSSTEALTTPKTTEMSTTENSPTEASVSTLNTTATSITTTTSVITELVSTASERTATEQNITVVTE